MALESRAQSSAYAFRSYPIQLTEGEGTSVSNNEGRESDGKPALKYAGEMSTDAQPVAVDLDDTASGKKQWVLGMCFVSPLLLEQPCAFCGMLAKWGKFAC
jgi:hypothetical protein